MPRNIGISYQCFVKCFSRMAVPAGGAEHNSSNFALDLVGGVMSTQMLWREQLAALFRSFSMLGALRRGRRLRWLVLAPFIIAFVSPTTAERANANPPGTRDDALCQQLPAMLIPLRVSRVRYRPYGLEEGSTEYAGHELIYTELELPSGPFVFSVGDRLVKTKNGVKRVHQGLEISSAPFFYSALWAIGAKRSDLGEYSLHSDIRLLTSITIFMRDGAKADAELLEDKRRGFAPSNEMYDCQGCSGAPAFSRTMAQDLNTIRFAHSGDHYFAVTTSPNTVVAEFRMPDKANLEEPEPPARYFSCATDIGQQIARDTALARRQAKTFAAKLMEPGE